VPVVPGDILDSWKAIAAHLHRDARTVLRWERARGLPVHRVPGGGKAGVYALKSELDAWWKGSRSPVVREAQAGAARRRSPSIAVLPFANLSSEKENEYFGDGLADGIITALTRVHGLRVTARTSSFAFRGHEGDVREIGRKLGVLTLLEGSVQRAGSLVRVSAQLVDVANGFHLWSEQYDRKASDTFAIQDEISHSIADALELRLAPVSGRGRTTNMEAYNLWLKGRYHQQYENVEALEKCRACFEGAVAADPAFPQPYLGLAELCWTRANFGAARPKDMAAQGWSAIAKAQDLDASMGEAYALNGAYRAWMDFDWKGAEASFERARLLTPASQAVHSLRAITFLVPTGRLAEAEQETERALELDPLSPRAHTHAAKVLLWARQFDRAHARIDAALELRPDYAMARWFGGAAFWFQGRREEAVQLWQTAMRTIGPNPVMMGAIGMGLGYLGRHAEARSILTELEATARARYVTMVAVAQAHLGLGETEAVFEWLGRAIEERDPHILDLPCKPLWDGLRSDPRFTELLRRMRLA
jgi:TolB-like protein/Flp pilus assembly protein TadD